MKTTVEVPEGKVKPRFPLLARSRSSGITVLFTGEREGMVIGNASPSEYFGYYSTSFGSVFDGSSVWEILPSGSKVTLEQE